MRRIEEEGQGWQSQRRRKEREKKTHVERASSRRAAGGRRSKSRGSSWDRPSELAEVEGGLSSVGTFSTLNEQGETHHFAGQIARRLPSAPTWPFPISKRACQPTVTPNPLVCQSRRDKGGQGQEKGAKDAPAQGRGDRTQWRACRPCSLRPRHTACRSLGCRAP